MGMCRVIVNPQSCNSEVQKDRRNLVLMWLAYMKAFDSVPQLWMLEALQLDEILLRIVKTIADLI